MKGCEANPEDGMHCWHNTGVVLDYMPPISVSRCCWCGNARQKMQPTEHGEYRP